MVVSLLHAILKEKHGQCIIARFEIYWCHIWLEILLYCFSNVCCLNHQNTIRSFQLYIMYHIYITKAINHNSSLIFILFALLLEWKIYLLDLNKMLSRFVPPEATIQHISPHLTHWIYSVVDVIFLLKKKKIYIYIYICVHIHTHTHTHIYMYVCVYVCICVYIRICMCTHTHTHVCVYTGASQ